MYEERKNFSLISFLVKAIIAIILILVVVWLLSLSNKSLFKDLSESLKPLNVLTDNIKNDNLSRLEQVGKDYFTTERLPKNIGDVEKITLKELYEKNLILEVKDKNGDACSAENSYISVTKLETEYQMKIYLECGEEKNTINVDMGCYDTCIDCNENEDEGILEYQYKKEVGGTWSKYGSWSEWSLKKVTATNSRQVQTKTVTETYYEPVTTTKTVTKNPTCPEGYTRNGATCVSTTTGTLKCPEKSGYTASLNGTTCTYTKTTTGTCPEGYNKNGTTCTKTITTNPVCPSGYTRNGATCTKTTSTDPTCPSGYTRNGTTCTKTTSTDPTCPSGYEISGTTCTRTLKADPICADKDDYSKSRSGFTCTYTKTISQSTTTFVEQRNGTYMPSDTSTYHYEKVSIHDSLSCETTCKKVTIYTYNVYRKGTTSKTETITGTASCPEGYVKNGTTCTKTSTANATCATGTLSNGKCVSTSTKAATCGTGTLSNGKCVSTSTTGATCATGTLTNGSCVENSTVTISCGTGSLKNGSCVATTTGNAVCTVGTLNNGICTSTSTKTVSCAKGYTLSGTTCSKQETTTTYVEKQKTTTYYRYRTRKYTAGEITYKWSESKNDKTLLKAGYKLTGKTRTVSK